MKKYGVDLKRKVTSYFPRMDDKILVLDVDVAYVDEKRNILCIK